MFISQETWEQIVQIVAKDANTFFAWCLFSSGVLALIYSWVLSPLNRIRRLGDVGLYFDPQLKGKYKERQLKRLVQLRRTGDLPPVFPNGWYCVAESDQIDCGEIKEVIIFGQIVSLVRSESGQAFVMDSYCPHLGVNFNIGGKVVNDNCVQCPFHGWIFSAETGKCTKIPYDNGTIPEQAKVATWPTVERNQHIYIWHHAEGEEPEWDIPDVKEMAKGEWTYSGRTEHEVMCHCQEIPENGADIAHLNYLHRSGPNEVQIGESSDLDSSTECKTDTSTGCDILKTDLSKESPLVEHNWNGVWEAGTGSKKHVGTMHLKQYLSFYGFKIPFSASKLRAEQYGPGIVFMNFDFGPLGQGVVLQHVTPEEPLLQRVRFKMYSNCPKWFAMFFLTSEAIQFERDIYIWSNKKYVKNPLVVRNDGPILKHRRWYSQFYTENSPRMLPNGEIENKPKSIHDW